MNMPQYGNPAGKVMAYYKSMPPKNRKIILIGAGILAFLVAKRLYDFFLRDDVSRAKRNRDLTNGIDSEIQKWKSKGLRATFPDTQYMIFANQIYEGMRYAIGDDYATVEKNMKKMMNDLDVALLIKAFGFRQDYAFGIPTGDPKDLFTFVLSELGDEYGGLTSYRVKSINADWKNKSISYQI